MGRFLSAWVLSLLLLSQVAAAQAQKVYPNGRRLPGKTAGFQFVDQLPVNLSNPATWYTFVGTGGAASINVEAGTTTFKGNNSAYSGTVIPITVTPGVQHVISFSTTFNIRVRVGPSERTGTYLSQSLSGTSGDYTFVFTPAVEQVFVTLDRQGTTNATVSNVTIFRE